MAAADGGAVPSETAAPERQLPQPISYQPPQVRPKTAVELEQERHQARARKFGVEYVEPRKDLLLSRAELRTEIARQRAGDRKGFAVGIDLFSEEEKAKKEKRAQRYGLATAAKDETDEERKRRLRAERFGVVEQLVEDEGTTMDVDALEVRQDVPDGAGLRLDTVYVYGTDTLSTKDVLHYFSGYGPSFVEWINDSSCNIVFEDEFAAKRALLSIGSREPGSVNEALPAPWFAGKAFERGDVRLPISLRVACTADVKPEEGVVSRHLWVRDGGSNGRGGRSRKRDRQAAGWSEQEAEDTQLQGRGFSDQEGSGQGVSDRQTSPYPKQHRKRPAQQSMSKGDGVTTAVPKDQKRGRVRELKGSNEASTERNKGSADVLEDVVLDRFTRKRTDDDDDE